MLSSCGGNSLLKDAMTSNNTLYFYTYDGETVTCRSTYNTSDIKSILNDFSSVNATEAAGWSAENVTYPIYGLEMSDKNGWTLQVAWSNGHLITQYGTVYEFDLDFSPLADSYEWDGTRRGVSPASLPCAWYLSQDGDGWIESMLYQAAEITAPEDIDIAVVRNTSSSVTVSITNHDSEDWGYGESFFVQVKLDGSWYEVPNLPGNYSFNSLGLILRTSETVEKTYNLNSYGTLPAGNYRIVTNGLTAEFTIE